MYVYIHYFLNSFCLVGIFLTSGNFELFLIYYKDSALLLSFKLRFLENSNCSTKGIKYLAVHAILG